MTDLLAGSDSDGEVNFTINESYAANYSLWREKEYMQQLKDRQQKNLMIIHEDEEESSEDDEDAKDLPKLEKSYFKALSYLKKRDPRIYDQNVTFFPDLSNDNSQENKMNKKDKPFFVRDYERHLILERDGKLSDDETQEYNPRASSPTYVEEQKTLKESFKHVLEDSEEETHDDIGNLFKKKEKTKAELKREEEDYREWLKGRSEKLQDGETESDLKGLHDFWNDPKLTSDEAYLKDYILNKRFLDPEDEDFQPAHNEIIHDGCPLENDLKDMEAMDNFEHKYNFRFEEPDSEFVKSYPRTVETSLRQKDDRRSRKRRELRERKEAEMAVKREEIKQLKALKKKEIMAKIEQIKEITGNNDVNFDEDDFEEDFNPEKHDQKMKEIFDQDYYQAEEEEKPACPELERDLEIEDWENWQGKDADNQQYHEDTGKNWSQPEAENSNFIMDCDYDPQAQLQEELKQMSKRKKKQGRKSKFAEAIAKEKPVYDPNNINFEDYFDEYYKLDCEDIIGDLPCRFKYRKTTPNDYGLTVDEILRADVKELNKWCSIKKVVKYKPDHVEKYEVHAYKQKAQNEALKRSILPSLYQSDPDNMQMSGNATGGGGEKMKKRKKKKQLQDDTQEQDMYLASERLETTYETGVNGELLQNEKPDKKRGKKRKYQNGNVDKQSFDSERESKQSKISLTDGEPGKFIKTKKSKVRKRDYRENETLKNTWNTVEERNELSNRFKKKKRNFHTPAVDIPISDMRLKAYGIHPKKFKNKIKYGNKQNIWNNK